ncbi:MAG: hypothetical protein KC944_25170, partial [Candidatus Omnitrophica bacterium]|nr:hypothetical protein [Candidatus Omnitrophota bacterium]
TKILFIAGCSALLIGCGGGNAPDYEMGKTTGEDVKKEVSEAYETAKDYAAEKRDEMQAKISKQYEQLKGEVQKMQVKASQASDESVEKLNMQKEKLKQQLDDLQPQIEKMKEAGKEAWSDLANGVQETLDEIQKGYQDLKEDDATSES